MLKLILTRHAKSSWDDPLVYDHDRQLTGRGVRSARAVGQWLSEQSHLPETILTSSATRAQMTAELIAEELEFKGNFTVESGLYHASADSMLKFLRQSQAQSVMMVGHNPGIADFASNLLQRAPSHSRFHDYPTTATLIANCDAEHWSEVGFGMLESSEFVVPRELIEENAPQ